MSEYRKVKRPSGATVEARPVTDFIIVRCKGAAPFTITLAEWEKAERVDG